MFIHTFGAYFGLVVARILYTEESTKSKKSESVYHSDLFSFVGRIVLIIKPIPTLTANISQNVYNLIQ